MDNWVGMVYNQPVDGWIMWTIGWIAVNVVDIWMGVCKVDNRLASSRDLSSHTGSWASEASSGPTELSEVAKRPTVI